MIEEVEKEMIEVVIGTATVDVVDGNNCKT